jgi:hypothetical protein
MYSRGHLVSLGERGGSGTMKIMDNPIFYFSLGEGNSRGPFFHSFEKGRNKELRGYGQSHFSCCEEKEL